MFSRFYWLVYGIKWFVDRVDVSHYRLSVHLLIAFIILSLIFWNYLKLKLIILNNKINIQFPLIFISLIFYN